MKILPKSEHAYEILVILIFILLALYKFAGAEELNPPLSQEADSAVPAPELPPGEEEGRRTQLERHFQDRITNLASNITSRLVATIARMENIIGRIDTRIVKLKDDGVETNTAEAKLNEAKETLKTAQSKLGGFPSAQRALGGDTPRQSVKAIQAEFLEVRELLRKTKALLIETVSLLKEAVASTDQNSGVNDAVTDDAPNATTTGAAE